MLTPSTNPPAESELVAHVRTWLNLVAHGRLDLASAQLDEPKTYGMTWTPDLIIQTIEAAYGPGSRFRAQHPAGPSSQESPPSLVTVARLSWSSAMGRATPWSMTCR